MPEADQPPENIYGNDRALLSWFEQVRYLRENPDSPGMERVPEAPPMERNSLMDDLGL